VSTVCGEFRALQSAVPVSPVQPSPLWEHTTAPQEAHPRSATVPLRPILRPPLARLTVCDDGSAKGEGIRLWADLEGEADRHVRPGDYLLARPAALGSPVGGGARSSFAGGPRISVRTGFRASAHTW
jgi:hypothetical protein